jgi:hypothetical protein
MPPEVINIVPVAQLLSSVGAEGRLFAAVDQLCHISLAEIIVARDPESGKEIVVLGRDLVERSEDPTRHPGPMVTVLVEHDTADYFELLELVTAVHGELDVEDGTDDDGHEWEEVGEDDSE